MFVKYILAPMDNNCMKMDELHQGVWELRQISVKLLYTKSKAAIAIILQILLTQFNSFVTPFIILTSVILSLVGVFIGLLVTGALCPWR